MATATVQVRINQQAVTALVTSIGGGMAQNAGKRVAQRVQQNITAAGRVDTGKMRAGIRSKMITRGVVSSAGVTSDQSYTIYQDQGTRAHGPVRAQFMVFTPKGGGGVVFAKWVRGVTPGRFFERAMASITAADFAP